MNNCYRPPAVVWNLKVTIWGIHVVDQAVVSGSEVGVGYQ